MTDKSNELIEIAKDNGAQVDEYYDMKEAIIFRNAEQLQATMDAVNSEVEPIYQIDIGKHDWLDVVKDVYNSHPKEKRIVYLHPPLSTGDYIKRSDVVNLLSGWDAVVDLINKLPSISVNKPDKPDNGHSIEEVSDALPVEPTIEMLEKLFGGMMCGSSPHPVVYAEALRKYKAMLSVMPAHPMPSQSDKANEQAVNDALEKAAELIVASIANIGDIHSYNNTELTCCDHNIIATVINCEKIVRALIKKG